MRFDRCAVGILTAALGVSVLPSCSATANIVEVYTAQDAQGIRRSNSFFTDSEQVHCIAKAGIGRPGVSVEAFVRQQQAFDFAENRYVPVNRVMAYSEVFPDRADAPLILALQLNPVGAPTGQGLAADNPFPPGRYECEFRLDGTSEGTAVFNIEFPPCPPAAITPRSTCIGFYKENDQCPAFGEGAASEPKCTCSVVEGWKC